MSAIDYNFIIEQGSDFTLNFQYNDENNNPVDLSDIGSKCVVLQIKPSSGNYVYTFSSSQPVIYDNYGFSLTASDQGLISFKLSASYTNKEFTFDTAVYDLDIISTNSEVLQNVRLAAGIITIKKRNIPLLDFCPGGDNPKSLNSSVIPSSSGGPTVTPTPGNIPSEDLCLPTNCLNTDIYAVVYIGSGLNITDNSTTSGSLNVTDSRSIENIELVIDKLNHSYPQDLQFLLAPPSGNKILLSANHKIMNYTNNFSFMFSNKANPSTYLHNVTNGGLCNIYDKTSLIKYNSETLNSSLNHLFGHQLSGDWSLIIRDTDPASSGSIDSWKLVVTYLP